MDVTETCDVTGPDSVGTCAIMVLTGATLAELTVVIVGMLGSVVMTRWTVVAFVVAGVGAGVITCGCAGATGRGTC